MTAISRVQIRAAIRFRGDYKSVRAFPDASLNVEIQTAFGHFWRIVDEAHQGWWDKQGTVTTTAGVAYVALPADAKVVKGVDRLDGDRYIEMPQVGLEHRSRFGSTQGRPIAHRLTARGIELAPTPDAAYTLRVMYSPKPPALTENEQHEWYDGWEDFVIEKVLWELDSREGKPLGDRMAKLEMAEKALRASSAQRRQTEPEYLRLHESAGDSFDDDGVLY
jgi:hypothetical protein